VYLFDPGSGRVRLAGRLGTAVGHASAVVLGGAMYVVGGLDASGRTGTVGTRVDPVASTVAALPLSVPVADAAVAEANGKAFLIGGRRNGSAVAEVRILAVP
jgi:N-acetylneuraminic acid mutarotase